MEFNLGDEVFVFLPDGIDPYRKEDFNAGWNSGMKKRVGTMGVIASPKHKANPGAGYDYLVKFDDGESWWWDERYIKTSTSTIKESDFSLILD